MAGGAMRQVGILAAAAHYALDHNLDRLQHDHDHALLLARALTGSQRVRLDLATVQTNIVIFHLSESARDASSVVQRAAERGVLLFAFGPRTLRLVTHMDVTRSQCEQAAMILLQQIEER
jgi:threonine aldolase